MKFSKRTEAMKASDIREMVKLTLNPKMINFAGGMPAPDLFPVDELAECADIVYRESGRIALQYQGTEGYLPLREKLAKRMKRTAGIECTVDEVITTNGSQQGIDFAGKVFLDEGDIVLTESPTYMGAINALRIYRPTFVAVPTDADGMIPEALEEALVKYGDRVKLIYVIPDYQNPSGNTWSAERRKKFVELIAKYETPTVEDSPYRELCFEGEMQPTLKSLDTENRIIYLGSFSKILVPGYRVAWICACPEIMEKMVFAAQGAYLQCSTIVQMEIDKYLERNDLDAHIEKIREVYRRRCQCMLSLMDEEFPKTVTYTRPKGGLFTWVTLPAGKNAKELLKRSLDEFVAFVIGESFYPNAEAQNTFRLSYANMPDEKIIEGMKRLGNVIRAFV
jgi:2-aminoadipate transaminase